jgi:hypothetical protein
VNSTLGLVAPNGSLYLVTGVDKSTNWCVASYSGALGDTETTLKFTVADAATVRATCQYSWESSRSIEARTCPTLREGNPANQCVFVRGYKLALSESLFERSFLGSVKVSDIATSNPSDILPKGRNIQDARLQKWVSKLFSIVSKGDPKELVESTTGEAEVTIEDSPEVSEVRSKDLCAFADFD